MVHPRDGRRLGTRTLPHARERLATYGSYLLKLSTVGDKVELKLVDPWAEQDVWSQSFDADSETCLVDHELVAVMQRSGNFRLMNIRDGSAVIDTQLEPDARLASIRVDRFNDQYLLMAGSPPLFSSKADSVKPLDGSKEEFTGHIYAFDRNTGRSMWENPVFLYRRGLVTSQARDLPVLTFAESHTKQRKPGRSSRSVSVSVLCLDRRTGRPVFEKDGLSQNDSVVRANGDPHDNTVTLSLRTTNYQLKFTEKPLPPEPSFEDDREWRPKSNKKGSIFNLLGSAD